MKKEITTVYWSIQDRGDGSVDLRWFLSSKEASKDQEEMYEGWSEDCSGSVGTYVGSIIHQEATRRKNDPNAW